MLDLSGNAAVDVFIGLAFFFFLLSIICSSINEGIATAFNLRAKDLEKGIHNLLGDPKLAKEFYEHWRVTRLFKPSRFLSRVFTDKRPSYIPPRVFALSVLDTVAPLELKPASAPADAGQHDLATRARRAATELGDANPTVAGLLQDALNEARGDADKLRESLERSFDEAMDRVSGWYKRRVQLILFAIALVLVPAINGDSFVLAQRLWKDQELRTAVVAQASATIKDSEAKCAKPENPGAAKPTPAETAAACLDEVTQLALPLGWSGATSPSGWEEFIAKIGGLLVTTFAVMLGAPFWFDLLGRVANLRGAGKPTNGDET